MLSVPNNENHLARWLHLFRRRVPPHQIETVSKGRIVTEQMIFGKYTRTVCELTLPRVRFLERGE